MNPLMTRYGELKGGIIHECYGDGSIRACVMNEGVTLKTSLGDLIPQFDHRGIRKKHVYSVTFFPNGVMSKIYLESSTEIVTPIGTISAELITFYENGSIKRVFPLNGQLSGYWGEEEEYGLAREYSFDSPSGRLVTKFIGVSFYESGKVKSITLWPGDTITIQTPIGEQSVRNGVAWYRSGKIRSFEPSNLIEVMTDIGRLTAYDTNAEGINGDNNSLCFREDGTVESLVTANAKIMLIDEGGLVHTYSPRNRELAEDEFLFSPLRVKFEESTIRFNEQDSFEIEKSKFIIEPYTRSPKQGCTDCASCKLCS